MSARRRAPGRSMRMPSSHAVISRIFQTSHGAGVAAGSFAAPIPPPLPPPPQLHQHQHQRQRQHQQLPQMRRSVSHQPFTAQQQLQQQQQPPPPRAIPLRDTVLCENVYRHMTYSAIWSRRYDYIYLGKMFVLILSRLRTKRFFGFCLPFTTCLARVGAGSLGTVMALVFDGASAERELAMASDSGGSDIAYYRSRQAALSETINTPPSSSTVSPFLCYDATLLVKIAMSETRGSGDRWRSASGNLDQAEIVLGCLLTEALLVLPTVSVNAEGYVLGRRLDCMFAARQRLPVCPHVVATYGALDTKMFSYGGDMPEAKQSMSYLISQTKNMRETTRGTIAVSTQEYVRTYEVQLPSLRPGSSSAPLTTFKVSNLHDLFINLGSERFFLAPPEHGVSVPELRGILYGVLFTIAMARQRLPGFRHNDLKSNNILLSHLAEPIVLQYVVRDEPPLSSYRKYSFETHWVPMIADFGYSACDSFSAPSKLCEDLLIWGVGSQHDVSSAIQSEIADTLTVLSSLGHVLGETVAMYLARLPKDLGPGNAVVDKVNDLAQLHVDLMTSLKLGYGKDYSVLLVDSKVYGARVPHLVLDAIAKARAKNESTFCVETAAYRFIAGDREGQLINSWQFAFEKDGEGFKIAPAAPLRGMKSVMEAPPYIEHHREEMQKVYDRVRSKPDRSSQGAIARRNNGLYGELFRDAPDSLVQLCVVPEETCVTFPARMWTAFEFATRDDVPLFTSVRVDTLTSEEREGRPFEKTVLPEGSRPIRVETYEILSPATSNVLTELLDDLGRDLSILEKADNKEGDGATRLVAQRVTEYFNHLKRYFPRWIQTSADLEQGWQQFDEGFNVVKTAMKSILAPEQEKTLEAISDVFASDAEKSAVAAGVSLMPSGLPGYQSSISIHAPNVDPTAAHTAAHAAAPTGAHTAAPTAAPTGAQTAAPTAAPTAAHTAAHTAVADFASTTAVASTTAPVARARAPSAPVSSTWTTNVTTAMQQVLRDARDTYAVRSGRTHSYEKRTRVYQNSQSQSEPSVTGRDTGEKEEEEERRKRERLQ